MADLQQAYLAVLVRAFYSPDGGMPEDASHDVTRRLHDATDPANQVGVSHELHMRHHNEGTLIPLQEPDRLLF